MKVLHVIPSVGEVRGGTSRAVLELVKAQSELPINVTIATTNDNGPTLLTVPLFQCIDYEQTRVYFFPRFSPAWDPIQEFAFSQPLTKWLWQHICDYDLVHVHALFSYASTIAMAIARARRVPYVTTPHGILGKWPLQQGTQKKKLYLKLIERANLNGARMLHFTSEKEQNETAPLHLKPPTVVIPHGLTPSVPIPDARQRLRQQFNLPADETVILFMSRLHPVKGLEYLIPALGQLTDQRFTFILAGSGDLDYEQVVQHLISSVGIQAHTHSVGFVRGEMKETLLQGSDIFVQTSYSENFGIAILEALAAGVPVVITPGVPLASMVQQYGFGYVADLSVTSIRSNIEYCLNHPEGTRVMGKRASQFIFQHYTWDRIAANLVELYETILEKKPLRRLNQRVVT